MSEVIRFLESIGSTPQGVVGSDAFNAMVESLDIDADQRRALRDRDQDALSRLLGGRRILRCSVFSPDEEEVPAEPDGDVPTDEPSELA